MYLYLLNLYSIATLIYNINVNAYWCNTLISHIADVQQGVYAGGDFVI